METTEVFQAIKASLTGNWTGEGLAKLPTIDDTAYTETCRFEPDADKNTIFYEQHTWYKNETPNNGKTVFWDTGFILLKEEKILLVSAQLGGRLETYELSGSDDGNYTFDNIDLKNDPKTIRSQRILHLSANTLSYELNISTHQATDFKNHLKAILKRS